MKQTNKKILYGFIGLIIIVIIILVLKNMYKMESFQSKTNSTSLQRSISVKTFTPKCNENPGWVKGKKIIDSNPASKNREFNCYNNDPSVYLATDGNCPGSMRRVKIENTTICI